MKKLFVDKTIEINAPRSKVWDALTKQEYTDKWAPEFSSGGPQFHIESDWKPGSPVLWKGRDGKVIVEGNVTAHEPNKLLRFTVFDVRSPERPPVTEEDGITYRLSGKNGKTTLQVLQGDFSVMTEGKKYRDLSAETWDRVLPEVKELAEKMSMQKFTTCLMFVREQHGKAEEAIRFYTSLFKNSKIIHIERYGSGEEEPEGTVKHAAFSLNGQEFMALDSAREHEYTFTPSMSIYVQCETEEELDALYKSMMEGGKALMPLDNYGFSRKFAWIEDRYGVSWQLNLAK